MFDDIATFTYVQLHNFYLSQKKRLNLPNYVRTDQKNRLKDAKLTLPEAACLLVLFQQSRIEHVRVFIQTFAPILKPLFPNLPSYARLCIWFKKSEAFLLDFAQSNLAKEGDRKTRYALDSTKINPHQIKNNPKSLYKQTQAGHTHEGLFIGMKLHALVNESGHLIRLDLSQGNTHDLTPVNGGMLQGIKGLVLADSGYVSAQIKTELLSQDLLLLAKPTLAQTDERWLFDRHYKKLYKQRQIVEGVFSVLKRCFGLQSRSVRSPQTLRARVWASITGYLLHTNLAS